MDAVAVMGRKIKELAALTADSDSIGCAKLVVFCNAVEDNPFMAGAFTGTGEGDAVINVGVSGPGVVQYAVEKHKGASIDEIAEVIKKTAFKITRLGGLVAREAAKRLGAEEGIVDLSLAPTPKIGDSVAHILEAMGLSSVGAHGTTCALAILNDAVKKGGVMASGRVGGLSGAFIPVSEDAGMINAVRRGSLRSKTRSDDGGLLGRTRYDRGRGRYARFHHKRDYRRRVRDRYGQQQDYRGAHYPRGGQKVGDEVNFGGLLGSAPVMSVRTDSSEEFIARGGKVPAPIHSNKN